MTDENDDDDRIATFEEAKQEHEKLIGELRQGDRGDRRLADLLARCRKGNRCNLLECPICERRKELPKWKVPSSVVKSLIGTRMPQTIFVDQITIVGKRRPPSEEKVRAMAASMDQVGLQTPITVRMEKKKVVLVAGYLRLTAARRLGWDAILSVTLYGNKTDARLWQIVENLYRDELTVLERAEHIEELRLLIRVSKEGQVAPPGGRQPREFGIKKTAAVLGLKREEVRRANAIAGISAKTKTKVRKLGLDDNQRALLEIARQPTPKAQLRTVKEIVKRRRVARKHKAAIGNKKTMAEIHGREAAIREKEAKLEDLKRDLTIERKHLEEIHDKLAVQDENALASLSAKDASDRKQSIASADTHQDSKVRSDVKHDVTLDQVMTSVTTSTDNEIPAFLDRRPLASEDQLIFDAIKQAWALHLQDLWSKAPDVVCERFIAELLMHRRRAANAPLLNSNPEPAPIPR